MRLTPLDIRKQEFKKAMRGLDSDEVYAFLSTIADEYEAVLNDNKALRERLLELDDKVQEYRNMEKTLRDTLLTAERVTVEAKNNARRESELVIKQAEIDAERGVRHIKANALKLRQEIQMLKRQRESYVARMKMLVESHFKFLETAEQDFVQDDRLLESELSGPSEAAAPVDEKPLDAGEPAAETAGEPAAETAEEPTPSVNETPVSRSAASVSPDEDRTGKPLLPPEPTPAAAPFVAPFPAASPQERAEERPMDALPDSNVDPVAGAKTTPVEPTSSDLNGLLDRAIEGNAAKETPGAHVRDEVNSVLEKLAEPEPVEHEGNVQETPEPRGDLPEVALPHAAKPTEPVDVEPNRSAPEPSAFEEIPRRPEPIEPANLDTHSVHPPPPAEEKAPAPSRPSEWSLERLKKDILSGRSKNDETG